MVNASIQPSIPIYTKPLWLKMFEAIDEHVGRNKDSVAFINAENNDVSMKFSDLKQRSLSFAQFLSDQGFSHKQVLCQVLPNCLQYPVSLLAVWRCGGTFSGASAMFTDYELERQFVDARCTAVLTDDSHLEKVLVAAKRCPLVKTIVCVRESGKKLPNHVFDFDEVIKTRFRSIPDYPYRSNDIAILPYSSGTTGSPKGVMLSHKNFGTMIDIVQAHQDRYFVHQLADPGQAFVWSDNSLCLMLPFYHIYGMGLLVASILRGSKGLVFPKFDPVHFLENIQKHKVRVIFLVPPILLFLAKHPLAQKYDLSSVRVVISGAAPAGRDLCEEFRRKHPQAMIAQAYGMTECGMASHITDLRDDKDYTSVGLLLPNFQQKIMNLETGKEAKTGERGEICVRSPTIMTGYLNRPDATKESIDDDGWLHTGDIGYLNAENKLTIVDRLKELIKVKGLQVPPAELEDLLLSHSSIGDAAVIGIKDERKGEVPLAFVVKSCPKLTEKEVQKFVEGKVSSYKWLAGVRFVAEIPKAPSGKILRRFLRDKVAQETASKL